MLPEHVDLLKQVFKEEDYKERPIVDEQQKMENDATLQGALKQAVSVEIKYFKDHDIHVEKGKVLFINVLDGTLMLEDVKIQLADVIEVIML